MTVYISRTKLNKMMNNIIDAETGMTEYDYYEWSHPYDEIIIIED